MVRDGFCFQFNFQKKRNIRLVVLSTVVFSSQKLKVMESIRRLFRRIKFWRNKTSRAENSSNKIEDNSNQIGENSNQIVDRSRNSNSSSYRKSRSPTARSNTFNGRLKKSKSAPCYVGSRYEVCRRQESDSSNTTYGPMDSSSATYDHLDSWSLTSFEVSSSSVDYEDDFGVSNISLTDETVSNRREAIVVSSFDTFAQANSFSMLKM